MTLFSVIKLKTISITEECVVYAFVPDERKVVYRCLSKLVGIYQNHVLDVYQS